MADASVEGGAGLLMLVQGGVPGMLRAKTPSTDSGVSTFWKQALGIEMKKHRPCSQGVQSQGKGHTQYRIRA